VRQHGGASEFDNNEINKFYKRSLVCFACLLLHANMTMQFLYQTKLVNERNYPKAFQYLPHWIYSGVVIANFAYIYRVNSKMMKEMD